MASNRITRRGAVLAALLLISLLAGCGGGGSSTVPVASAPTTTGTATNVDTPMPSPEQSADAVVLNEVLARQEAAIGAYAQVIPKLSPRLAHLAGYLRAQEQEHVDAVLKTLRGLKGSAEPSAETIEVGDLRNDRERLEFLYEVESATIDEELAAITDLEDSSSRSLLSSTVANQAQHLTLLRQALGAGPLASVPVPFENGTAPSPE